MTAPSAQGPSAVHGGKGKTMSQRRAHVGARLKRRWLEFWGLVFFAGICINFAEIICRTLFHFSIDLMYDLPVWLTIWAVMMVAGPILPDGDHVSVDMLRNALPRPARKVCDVISGLATVVFGVVISWSGFIFISQCLEFNMNIIRCVSVPRWLVESCVGLGMAMFTVFAVYRLWGVVRDKHAPEAAEPEE